MPGVLADRCLLNKSKRKTRLTQTNKRGGSQKIYMLLSPEAPISVLVLKRGTKLNYIKIIKNINIEGLKK